MEPTKLPTTFTKSRIAYSQLTRIGSIALYECRYTDGVNTWYEIIRIKPADIEKYPKKTDFGKSATSIFGPDSYSQATNFFQIWSKSPDLSIKEVRTIVGKPKLVNA